jgi:hypothetical protein
MKQIMLHVLKMLYISLLSIYTKLLSRGVFLHVFAYVNAGLWRVNIATYYRVVDWGLIVRSQLW